MACEKEKPTTSWIKTLLIATVGDSLGATWINYTDWEYVAETILGDFKDSPNNPELLKLEAPGGMVQRILTMNSETTKAELVEEIEDYMAKAWGTGREAPCNVNES